MPSHVGLLLGQAVDWLPQVGHKTTLFSVALSPEGSVGTDNLVSKVLLGLLAFLCHQLNTLLPSVFLGHSVCSPVQASLPRDQLNLCPHHPFPMAETTRGDAPRCLTMQDVCLSCLPPEPSPVQRGQAYST